MFGEHRFESSQSFRCFDVSDDTYNDHRRGLDDGHCFHYFLFVHLWKSQETETEFESEDNAQDNNKRYSLEPGLSTSRTM